MKSTLGQLPFIALLTIGLVGCSPLSSERTPPEFVEDNRFNSKTFHISTTQGTIALGQNEGWVLEYSAVVKNASSQDLEKVNVQIIAPQEIGDYLATGVVSTPPTDFDLVSAAVKDEDIPEGGARGIEVGQSSSLIDESDQQEYGRALTDLLTQKFTMELTITWNGGSESYSYPMSITDPDGLLD